LCRKARRAEGGSLPGEVEHVALDRDERLLGKNKRFAIHRPEVMYLDALRMPRPSVALLEREHPAPVAAVRG